MPEPHVNAETRARAAEDASLWAFVDPLLAGWVQIATIAVAGAAIAFTLASLRRPVYEATAVVRVAGDHTDAVRTETLRPLLENRTSAGELVREFGVTSEPAWTFVGGSSPVPADTFFENHGSVEHVATNLLRVRVRLGNAELAAKVANGLVERANALDRLNQKEAIDALEKIKTRLEEADGRLDTLKSGLMTFKRQSQADAKSAPEASLTLLEMQTAFEYERALAAYLDLSTRYEDARIRTGNRGARFQLVDPAMPPSAPISPRVLLITQLSGIFGLLVGCLLVLGRHSLHRHRLR